MKFEINKRLAAPLVLAGFAGLACQAANAATVSSLFKPGNNLISDNSAEFFINLVGDEDYVVDVGDKFRGILQWETVEAGGNTNNFNEFTGIFQLSVIAKSEVNVCQLVSALCGTAAGDVIVPDTFNYFFGPDADFVTEMSALTGQALDPGTMLVLFDEDLTAPGAVEFKRETAGCATIALCEATATGGNLWATLGFGGDPDELWATFASPEDLTPSLTVAEGSAIPGGQFNVQLSFLDNFTGLEFAQVGAGLAGPGGDGFIDVNAQGGLVGVTRSCGPGSTNCVPGKITPYDFFNNVDGTVNVVPEPGVLALLGASLLGAGAARRRRG